MKFIFKIAIALSFLVLGKMAVAQTPARIILNNNSFVVMNNTVNIVIDNDNSNGITEANGGGMIVSENEDNELIWHINNQTGQTYTVPFGTTPVSQGGNGVEIPVIVTVTAAGTQNTSGSITFSTWETTNDDNTPLPTGVTNASNGLNAVDRFWEIYPTDYSVNPEVNISFTYADNVNEIGGSNTLVETNLTAQNYNTTTDLWQSTVGSVNVSNNMVNGVALNATEFTSTSRLWTLVDATSPLPVTLTHFTGNCVGTETELTWTTASEINNDYFMLEKSVDAISFFDVETIQGAGNSNVVTTYAYKDSELNNQIVYYRLKQVDFNGDFEYSTIISISPCSDETFTTIYPNPFKDILNLKFSDNNDQKYEIELTDYLGRTIIQETAHSNNSIHTIKMDQIKTKGVYFIKIKNGNQMFSKKIIKQ